MLTRQKQGKFIGTKAPYGYIKDPADKNHLLIDERYAPVVRRIFGMARDGMGIVQIAKQLTAEKIPRPVAAAAEELTGYDRYLTTDESAYKWSMGSVREILRNPVYKGAIRGQKCPKISLKCNKRKPKSVSGEFVVDGMHEPIIDPEEWELVRRLITSRKKVRGNYARYDNIFAGLIKCADCGYALSVARAHRFWNDDDINANFDHQCNSYRSEGKAVCTQHRIVASELHNAILADIKRLANEALEDDKKMISSIAERLGKAEKDNVRQAERELKRAQKRPN
ncbi:MAG: recombinase family protein [Ruminococcus sp.]|nr:recombinase family protein [Ruminococcus sp.]